MIMGILLVGYFHFRAINRLNDFSKAIGLSFLGLIAFFILYIIVNALAFKILPHYLSSVILPIIMPVIGAVTGLNFIILNQKEGESTRVE
jgi:ABC-type Na+ efflux pump permease subunit